MSGAPRKSTLAKVAQSLATSLILMLAAFPLISWGSTDGPTFLMWLGLIFLGVGGLIPLARRYAQRNDPPKPPHKTGPIDDVRVS